MANTWTVTASGVELNSTPISGYLSHEFWVRNNTEGVPFLEVGLVVRVDDAVSEGLRDDAVSMLPTAVQATLNAENTLRPTTREIQPVVGDTIVITISDQVLVGAAGSAGWLPGNTGGTLPI